MKALNKIEAQEVNGGYAIFVAAAAAYVWYEYYGGKEVINSLMES